MESDLSGSLTSTDLCKPLIPSCSADTNAANSPLLLLPPEIRCRIYDYAFGGFVIHLSADDSKRKYVLSQKLCQSPQTCASLHFQHHRILPMGSGYKGACTQLSDDQKLEHITIPVHMLQVCRQIYHEAVLKPFAQTTFHFGTGRQGSGAANMFLKKLVPEQVRSIASLYIVFRGYVTSRPLILQFKGLKHPEIHMEYSPAMFAQRGGTKDLKEVGLKSIRFTAAPQLDENKAHVLEWFRLQEIEILSKQQPMLAAD
jgi:hypothetical protein